MREAISGRSLPITGIGEETRDFTFVEDIVNGLLAMGVDSIKSTSMYRRQLM